MLVIIAIMMILTDQCAGGAFVYSASILDCNMSQSSSSILLEHSSFHCSNTNARGVQKTARGLHPQMAILWDATMSPRAIHQVRLVVAADEAAVQSVHWLFP